MDWIQVTQIKYPSERNTGYDSFDFDSYIADNIVHNNQYGFRCELLLDNVIMSNRPGDSWAMVVGGSIVTIKDSTMINQKMQAFGDPVNGTEAPALVGQERSRLKG